MFADKSNKSKTKRRGASFHESAVTILTPGCHFSGKLYCKGSSRIGGKVEGEIISEGVLIIEEEAQIAAEIKADEVVIQGTVEGKLEATGKVELTSTSHFNGDIKTSSLVINEGAKFNGHTSMNKDNEKDAKFPVVEKLHKKGASKKDIGIRKVPEVEAQP